MKTITVKFAGAYGSVKTYVYQTDIEGIEVGDTVVVDAPSSGMTCVKVVSVEESADSVTRATKWIVAKVDVQSYKDRLEADKRRATIIAKLRKRQAMILENNMYAQLAEMDPEAKALVEELKSLA